ncbi:MAG: hypothetical protein U9N85_11965 [Bacteroidota bacterium]|nr:hypothetical protein [Bacteroidota bacterium]
MIIENKLTTAKLRISYLIILGLVFSLGAYTMFENNALTIEYSLSVFIIVLILAYVSMLFFRLNYFYMKDTGHQIDVRYYSAHPFFRKYKAFKLPVSAISSYQLKKSVFGLKQAIIITANVQQGEFIFPSISISALGKNEKQILLSQLDKYSE